MTRATFDVVVAMDRDRGIARDGGIPWHVRGDMAHFRSLTQTTEDPARRNAVIMGRVTWESLPARFRPLPGRLNVVLSRRPDPGLPEGVIHAAGLEDALVQMQRMQGAGDIERVFVIGGGQVYARSLALPPCRDVYVTRIDAVFGCDVFFPELEPGYQRSSVLREAREGDLTYRIEVWRNRHWTGGEQ